MCGVAPIVQDHIRLPGCRRRGALVDTPPERLFALPTPREYRETCSDMYWFQEMWTLGRARQNVACVYTTVNTAVYLRDATLVTARESRWSQMSVFKRLGIASGL